MNLPHYNWKDFTLHQYKFFTCFTLINSTWSICETFWTIFSGHHSPDGMYSSKMHSSIQHPNMYCLTFIQHNQSNTPIIMCPNNVYTSKWSHFSSDHAIHKYTLCCYATSEFHKLGKKLEQITSFITNHSQTKLKIHLKIDNFLIHRPWVLIKKFHIFWLFHNQPHGSLSLNSHSLILSGAHYLHPRTFWYLPMKKLQILLFNHLWLTTYFLAMRAQIPKIILKQPCLNNTLSNPTN